MYDHILVPLKGDSTDEAVVAHTGSLARLSGGAVTLLRVIHSHSRDEATLFEEQARAYLDGQVARLAAERPGQPHAGVPVHGTGEALGTDPGLGLAAGHVGHAQVPLGDGRRPLVGRRHVGRERRRRRE